MTDQASFVAFVVMAVAVFVPMTIACWHLDRGAQQKQDEEAAAARSGGGTGAAASRGKGISP